MKGLDGREHYDFLMKLKTTAAKKSGHGGHVDERRWHWKRLFKIASWEKEATWNGGYEHILFCKKNKTKQKQGTLCPEFISLKGERVVGYSNVLVLVPIEFWSSSVCPSLPALGLATYMLMGPYSYLPLTQAWLMILLQTWVQIIFQLTSKSTLQLWKVGKSSLSEPSGLP